MKDPIHLPAAVRKAQPWKNGGGRTTTIVEEPLGAIHNALDWRISIADIDTPGPFSLFPSMTRYLLLLWGGVRLIGQDVDAVLGISDDACVFSGDTEIYATPLANATRVLNVMVRRDRFRGSLSRAVTGKVQLHSSIAIYVAARATAITIAGQKHHLRSEDSVVLTEPTEVNPGPDLIEISISAFEV